MACQECPGLLWALVLGIFLTLMVWKFRRRATDPLVVWATIVGLGVALFFFGLMLGPANPFETLDQSGVGDLMRIAVERGRRVKPELKLGICGEHGGEAESVAFCHGLGLDYVSCSPYRVPLARLAAAQAVLEEAGVEAVSVGG